MVLCQSLAKQEAVLTASLLTAGSSRLRNLFSAAPLPPNREKKPSPRHNSLPGPLALSLGRLLLLALAQELHCLYLRSVLRQYGLIRKGQELLTPMLTKI